MGSDSSDKSLTDDEAFLEQLEKGTLRNMRVLWCELPEVKESGILDNIKREERKRQEAMFEVITSEASYLRSLNILMSQFIKSEELNAGSSLCVLERGQSHVLFSNINSIKSVSENFVQALRARQKEAVVISSISDIIEQHKECAFFGGYEETTKEKGSTGFDTAVISCSSHAENNEASFACELAKWSFSSCAERLDWYPHVEMHYGTVLEHLVIFGWLSHFA
ncbi:unnamed protein product [Porites lobata]|uniref:DH domain-containing protein n=1 Tax=Porites lobata TaxID=104759 RepID=A0ABN8RUL9_9CNID|nr:unnamed protein product [Porites lobata]